MNGPSVDLILIAGDAPQAGDAEFERWLDHQYVARRQTAAGVRRVRRFVLVDGDRPKHLVVCDVEDLSLLQRPETRAVLNGPGLEVVPCRRIFEASTRPGEPAPDSRYLLVVMFNVPDAYDDEFNDWYNTEHIPMLLQVPGWLRAQRFVAEAGEFKYIAVHDLTGPSVFSHPAYLQARNTPWRQRITRLRTGYGRGLYELQEE